MIRRRLQRLTQRKPRSEAKAHLASRIKNRVSYGRSTIADLVIDATSITHQCANSILLASAPEEKHANSCTTTSPRLLPRRRRRLQLWRSQMLHRLVLLLEFPSTLIRWPLRLRGATPARINNETEDQLFTILRRATSAQKRISQSP